MSQTAIKLIGIDVKKTTAIFIFMGYTATETNVSMAPWGADATELA